MQAESFSSWRRAQTCQCSWHFAIDLLLPSSVRWSKHSCLIAAASFNRSHASKRALDDVRAWLTPGLLSQFDRCYVQCFGALELHVRLVVILCVCMCMCMCMCMCYVHVYVCMRAGVCVCARVHLPVCLVLPCMICTSSGAVSAV